jgi:hypothetical protein
MAELSGKIWVSRFPGSSALKDLDPGFRSGVEKFIQVLTQAGAAHKVVATLRPPERAYLMHYAWLIAKGLQDPNSVPARHGVDIDWSHSTHAASVAAAKAMVSAFGISKSLKVAPALDSRHTEGKAIDMSVSWTGNLTIALANGSHTTLTGAPRNHTNPALITVAATYHVIHFKKVSKDPTHWSTDGH